MVGVYKINYDSAGSYIKYYKNKYYLKDLDELNINYIIDYNNGFVIFK